MHFDSERKMSSPNDAEEGEAGVLTEQAKTRNDKNQKMEVGEVKPDEPPAQDDEKSEEEPATPDNDTTALIEKIAEQVSL